MHCGRRQARDRTPPPPPKHIILPHWPPCFADFNGKDRTCSAMHALHRRHGASGKQPHFSVGECSELIFTEKTVRTIFDLRKNGGNGTLKNGYLFPFSSYFSATSSTTFRHNPPQHILCTMPAIPPPFQPPFFSINPHVAPFSPLSPFFEAPKSWFVSW